MKLVLFRHGIAVDHDDPDCPPDDERPLTDKGRRKTEEAARGLRAMGVKPGVVFSSRLVRAVQTAEIVVQEIGYRSEVKRLDSLRPESTPLDLFEDLAPWSGKDLLCVGHNPNLERVLAAALGLRAPLPASIKKAGGACIELPSMPGRGTLEWFLGNKDLRALGGS